MSLNTMNARKVIATFFETSHFGPDSQKGDVFISTSIRRKLKETASTVMLTVLLLILK